MKKASSESRGYYLRSGLFMQPEQEKELTRLIAKLQRELPAQFILLADAAGQVVAARGEYVDANLVMLGSLVAGDLAASQEIARLTGEYQEYQLVLREGEHSHIFIAEAGSHLILLVQVDRDVPLGWGRMLILKTARQLAQSASQGTPSGQEIAEMQKDLILPPDEAERELADLFGDALDEMWGE